MSQLAPVGGRQSRSLPSISLPVILSIISSTVTTYVAVLCCNPIFRRRPTGNGLVYERLNCMFAESTVQPGDEVVKTPAPHLASRAINQDRLRPEFCQLGSAHSSDMHFWFLLSELRLFHRAFGYILNSSVYRRVKCQTLLTICSGRKRNQKLTDSRERLRGSYQETCYVIGLQYFL